MFKFVYIYIYTSWQQWPHILLLENERKPILPILQRTPTLSRLAWSEVAHRLVWCNIWKGVGKCFLQTFVPPHEYTEFQTSTGLC